jgi:hypothetical protein
MADVLPAREKFMSTLEIRNPLAARPSRRFSGFLRMVAVLSEVLDVFAEAQRQAHEAQGRYPFTSC